MPPGSPVVIDSSSPIDDFPRLLSVTPPSHPPERHLSSSPERRVSGHAAASYSSPGLPSPSTLLRPRAPPKSLAGGSKARPIPEGAGFGFVSAASLARAEEPFVDVLRKEVEEEKEKIVKKPRKRAVKATEDGADGAPKETVKKPRKKAEREKVTETTELEGAPAEVKKPRKRAPKATKDGESIEAKGDGVPEEPKKPRKRTKKAVETVTEDASAAPLPEPRSLNFENWVAKDFELEASKTAKPQSPKKAEAGESSAYFVPPAAIPTPAPIMEAASRRRRSWTPVKDTEATLVLQGELEGHADDGSIASGSKPRVPLSELLANFTYSNGEAAAMPPPQRTVSGEATTKRSRIDLGEASVRPAAPKEKVAKPKAPKKKAQTITELATAAYRTTTAVEAAPNADSGISSHFASVPAPAPVLETAETPGNAAAKPKKPRKPRAKAGEATNKEPKVRKTTKAKKGKAFNEADFLPPLYSPERACNQIQQQDFLFGTSSQIAAPESPTFIREMQTAMQESEAIGFGGSQIVTRVPTAPHGTCLSVGQGERQLWRTAARDFNGGLHRDNGLAKSKFSALSKASLLAKERLKATSAVEQPPEQVPEAAEQPQERMPEHVPNEPPAAETDTQAQQQDEHSSAVPVPHQHAEASKAVVPAKAATQPTADKTTWTHIDEISDDEPCATPSPPRRQANAAPSIFNPLPLSPSKRASETDEAPAAPLATTGVLKPTDAQWLEKMPSLFSQITSTVKTAPPTGDSAQPSWNEKILLYDPIVLEDITAWLNEQGLRIDVKRKLAAKARKKKATAATDGGTEQEGELDVEIKEEPLQGWMVQKWCEEKSICCLWKEGLRGGVRTKY